jgi:hypothetical protein
VVGSGSVVWRCTFWVFGISFFSSVELQGIKREGEGERERYQKLLEKEMGNYSVCGSGLARKKESATCFCVSMTWGEVRKIVVCGAVGWYVGEGKGETFEIERCGVLYTLPQKSTSPILLINNY